MWDKNFCMHRGTCGCLNAFAHIDHDACRILDALSDGDTHEIK